MHLPLRFPGQSRATQNRAQAHKKSRKKEKKRKKAEKTNMFRSAINFVAWLIKFTHSVSFFCKFSELESFFSFYLLLGCKLESMRGSPQVEERSMWLYCVVASNKSITGQPGTVTNQK